MCGRYQLKADQGALQLFLDGFFFTDHQPRYNIAPTQRAPIIRQENGKTAVRSLRFGLIPSWVQSPPEQPLVNARFETVFEKPSFRSSIQFQRCLVPATGFYEWERESKSKLPVLATRPTEPIFAFAGLWASWQEQGRSIESFAIITRAAGKKLAPIHHRAPVWLPRDAYLPWIAPNTSKYTIEAILNRPDDDEWFLLPISQRVNQVKYDDEQCEAPRAVQQSLF